MTHILFGGILSSGRLFLAVDVNFEGDIRVSSFFIFILFGGGGWETEGLSWPRFV